jgi:hypothetical protein
VNICKYCRGFIISILDVISAYSRKSRCLLLAGNVYRMKRAELNVNTAVIGHTSLDSFSHGESCYSDVCVGIIVSFLKRKGTKQAYTDAKLVGYGSR